MLSFKSSTLTTASPIPLEADDLQLADPLLSHLGWTALPEEPVLLALIQDPFSQRWVGLESLRHIAVPVFIPVLDFNPDSSSSASV